MAERSNYEGHTDLTLVKIKVRKHKSSKTAQKTAENALTISKTNYQFSEAKLRGLFSAENYLTLAYLISSFDCTF